MLVNGNELCVDIFFTGSYNTIFITIFSPAYIQLVIQCPSVCLAHTQTHTLTLTLTHTHTHTHPPTHPHTHTERASERDNITAGLCVLNVGLLFQIKVRQRYWIGGNIKFCHFYSLNIYCTCMSAHSLFDTVSHNNVVTLMSTEKEILLKIYNKNSHCWCLTEVVKFVDIIT